jgi:hypothetical protein
MEDYTLKRSDAVKEYTDAYSAYRAMRATPCSWEFLGLRRASGELRTKLMAQNGTVDADTTITDEQFWKSCNPLPELALTTFDGLDEGVVDSEQPFNAMYTCQFHDKRTKIPLENDIQFANSDGFSSKRPHPSLSGSSKSEPACYGLKIDSDGMKAAIDAKDLCKLTLTAQGCAPGWTVEHLQAAVFCARFTTCKQEAQKSLDDWKDIIKAEKTEFAGLSQWHSSAH